MAVKFVVVQHLISSGAAYIMFWDEGTIDRVSTVFTASFFDTYEDAMKAIDGIKHRAGVFQIEKIFYNA